MDDRVRAIALAMGMRPVIWTASNVGVPVGGSSIQWDSQGAYLLVSVASFPNISQIGAFTLETFDRSPTRHLSKAFSILPLNSPTLPPLRTLPLTKVSSSSNTISTSNPSTWPLGIPSHTLNRITHNGNSRRSPSAKQGAMEMASKSWEMHMPKPILISVTPRGWLTQAMVIRPHRPRLRWSPRVVQRGR